MLEIADLLKKLEEYAGLKAYIGDNEELKVECIPFLIPQLDRIIGGGAPRGRIIEITGDFSTGKTTLTQFLCRSAQEMGLSVVYFNAENKYDPSWFRATGVKVEEIVVVQGNLGERVLDAVNELIQAGVGLIVVDSIAALIPIAEYTDDLENKHMGTQAKLMSEGYRKIIQSMSISKTCLVFLNQMRSAIGQYVGGDKPPGGKAQFFYSSMILHVRRGEWIDKTVGSKQIREGFHIMVKSTKNTIAPPWQEADLPFYFTGKIDMIMSLVNLAIDFGIIEKSGTWYVFNGTKIQGIEKTCEHFKANGEAARELAQAISEHD